MIADKRTDLNPVPLQAARVYTAAGLSVIPLDPKGSKKPHWDMLPRLEVNGETKARWFPFQKTIAPGPDVERWFDPAQPCALGVVGGKVSGNLNCIDFDWEAAAIFPEWKAIVEQYAPGLVNRLTIHKTPKGWHVWYRCPGVAIAGNTELAIDPKRPTHENTLIETRGEGGYAGVPGSPPPGPGLAAQWVHHSGPKLSQVASINADEHEIILAAAIMFDRRPRKPARDPARPRTKEQLPIDDFLARGPSVLEQLGPDWPLLNPRGHVQHLERPDRGKGSTSATLGFKNDRFGNPMLYLFTSNAPPLPARKFLDSFGVYVWLKHQGDMKAAVKDIAGQGYGIPNEKKAEDDEDKKKPPKLLEILLDAEYCLWTTPKKEAYATIQIGECLHHWEIGSTNFDDWCADVYYQKTGQGCTDNSLKDAARVLKCKARISGERHETKFRAARVGGSVYVDLCNDAGQALAIDAEGWRLLPSAPVKFIRNNSMFALATPVAGGRLEQLRDLLNLDGEVSWLLFGAFLGYCWYGTSSYPVLLLGGEHGAAKSTSSKICKRLIDPNEGSEMEVPETGEEVMTSARAGLLCAFDNVSFLTQSQSDAICRLSTGGGFVKRKMYTDGDVYTFRLVRPCLLTGITDIAVSADLIDRSFNAKLLPIPDTRRQTDEEFWERFSLVEPQILGALADAVSKALAILPTVHLARKPRMADFAMFGEAFWRGQGRPAGSFAGAVAANRHYANAVALENNEVAGAIIRFVEQNGDFHGKPGELLEKLENFVTDSVRKSKRWPGSACHLSRAIDRLAPDLRRAGIECDGGVESGRRASRFISLKTIEDVAQFAQFAQSPDVNPLHTQCLLPEGVEDVLAQSAQFAQSELREEDGANEAETAPTPRLDDGAENPYY